MDGVGERIAAARAALGLSRAGLAALAGTTRVNVFRLETGRRRPSVGSLVALAKALGVTAGHLLGEEEAKAPAAGAGRVKDKRGR
jgi:transcriptional regulator with XRE-family HTH domain